MSEPAQPSAQPSAPPPALFKEPYRVLFPVAMALGVLLIGAWGVQLGRGGGVLSPAVHGALMLWGVYGTAVLGFLLTAYPKQNGAAQPPSPVVLALAGVQVLAVVLWLVGGTAALVGGALATLTWAGVTAWAAAIAVPSIRRGWDATTATVPFILATATVALGLAVSGKQPVLAPALAIHGVFVPLALTLLDRILPFFSRKRVPGYDGLRRVGFTGNLLVLGILRALVEGRISAVALDALLIVLIARQWQGWRPLQGLRPPLLGVLHLGIAWLLLGYLVDVAAPFLDPTMALYARHLWTVGGLGTLVMSIAIRVTRGHGGLPLVLGWDGALMVGLVQLAVLLRGGLPLFGLTHPLLWPAAAACLGLAMLLYLLRLAPAVLRS